MKPTKEMRRIAKSLLDCAEAFEMKALRLRQRAQRLEAKELRQTSQPTEGRL